MLFLKTIKATGLDNVEKIEEKNLNELKLEQKENELEEINNQLKKLESLNNSEKENDYKDNFDDIET